MPSCHTVVRPEGGHQFSTPMHFLRLGVHLHLSHLVFVLLAFIFDVAYPVNAYEFAAVGRAQYEL